jgi:AcrR family transcriptional regulator
VAERGKVVPMDSSRRIGAKDSLTRAKLLDAAEQLMLEEGYAAVTSRRVGREAGISSQLVHYYFLTMDDLFLEVFRRRAEEGFARFERAIEAKPTLRTIWNSLSDGPGSVFNLEFASLANHRKAIRAEMASYAERFRTMQLEAITSILAARGTLPAGITPEVVLVAMAGVAQLIALERALGVSGGHDRTLAFIEQYLDDPKHHAGTGARRRSPTKH